MKPGESAAGTETVATPKEVEGSAEPKTKSEDQEFEEWLAEDEPEAWDLDEGDEEIDDGDEDEGEDSEGEKAPKRKKDAKTKGEKSSKDESDTKGEGDKGQSKSDGDGSWVLKVGDKEHRIDPKDTDKIKQLVQKGLGADSKFQEAAQARKQAESLIKDLQQDPIKVITHPALGLDKQKLVERLLSDPKSGVDRRSIAERILLEEYSNDADPQGAELRRLQQENETYRQQQERDRQQQEHDRREREAEATRQRITADIVDALENSTVPKNDWTVKRMAQYLKAAIAKGIRVTPRDVIKYVENDWRGFTKEALKSIPQDKLLDELPEGLADTIRRENLKRQGIETKPPAKTDAPRKRAEPRRLRNADDVFESAFRALK